MKSFVIPTQYSAKCPMHHMNIRLQTMHDRYRSMLESYLHVHLAMAQAIQLAHRQPTLELHDIDCHSIQ